MARNRSLSPTARNVLAILLEAGEDWSHGYALGRAAGIPSGTLYPLLIRLEEQEHLEAQWQPPSGPGRPARHAYRLSAAGRVFAAELLRGEAPGLVGKPA